MTTSAARITAPTTTGVSLLIEPAQRFFLGDVTWDQYVAISDALPERGNVHVTYDNGRLELVSISDLHELVKYLLGRLLDILIDEFEMDGNGYGQMTHRRKDLAKALEADACYYFRSWMKIRNLGRRIDLSRDPPPDLALEIDVTSSSIPRMPIYQKLGIRELWRFKDETVTVYVLNRQGKYKEMPRSPTFPLIPPGELVSFVRLGIQEGGRVMANSFKRWVQEKVAESK